MKTKSLVSLFALLSLLSSHVSAATLGTAFTYQGRLQGGPGPADGTYDLKFTPFDSGPGPVARPITNAAVAVSNGLSTVTLDLMSRAADQYALRLRDMAANGGTNIRLADGAGRWADLGHYYGTDPFTGRPAVSNIGFQMANGDYFAMRDDGQGATCSKYIIAKGFLEYSDRNRKRDVEPVKPGEVLERVVSLPISTWAFTSAVNTRHLGPLAQDFHAAFGLGGR